MLATEPVLGGHLLDDNLAFPAGECIWDWQMIACLEFLSGENEGLRGIAGE